MNDARPYVIVVGGGKVGYYLTRHLLERDYEVTLIEKNPRRAEWIQHQMGTVSIMVGDGDEMAFIATTGIERAGVLVAATGDDEDNLIACQLAKSRFGVARTIARVNNPVNVDIFKALGVDVAVSATELLMGLIEAELSGPGDVKGVAVKASGANLIDVALPEDSTYIGRRIADLRLPNGGVLVCIVRRGEPVIAAPEVTIMRGDELIVYTRSLDVESIRRALAGD